MKVLQYKDKAYVELKPGEDIFTVLRDPKRQLKGYQNTIAALRDTNKKLMEKYKLPWWIPPNEPFDLPKQEEEKKPRGEAAVDFCHHFKMRRFPQIIDVYMGFMDEEVNARLGKILKEQGDESELLQRPVVLIERGQIDPGDPILEWRMGNYRIGDKKSPVKRVVQVSPKGEMVAWETGKKKTTVTPLSMPEAIHWKFWEDRDIWLEKRAKKTSDKEESTEPEDIIARAMGVYMQTEIATDLDWLARGLKVKRYFDIIKLMQHRWGDGTKSEMPARATGEGPYLSVVRFDVGNKLRAPIVVIRSPEMGLQPSLMSPYLAFLFKALSAASSEMAAVEAKGTGQVVVAKGEWSKAEYKDELWKEADEKVYKDKKKLKNWDVWEWPLRVSQFGAQGSASELKEHTPGNIVTVVASLFVGVEIARDVKIAAEKSGSVNTVLYRHGPKDNDPSEGEDAEQVKTGGRTADDPNWVVPEGEQVRGNPQPYSRIIGSDTTVRAYAVISLCTPAGVYDFVRDEIKDENDVKKIRKRYELPDKEYVVGGKRTVIDVANEVAAEVFRSQTNDAAFARLKLKSKEIDSHSPFCHFEEEIGDNETLESVVTKVRVAYKKNFFQRAATRQGQISLTVAYFGGDKDKDAASALGILGVNMEDYHILRVLRSALAQGVQESSTYPIILGWRIDRINCDPKKLPDDVEENFNVFALDDKALLTVDEYVKVIIWGLRGVLLTDIKENAHLKNSIDWKYVSQSGYFPRIEDLKKYFWSFVDTRDPKEFWVPDPFCIEMAADFLTSLANWKPNKQAISQFDDKAKVAEIKKRATAVIDAWNAKDSSKDSFAEVYGSTEQTGTVALARKLVVYLCAECGFAALDQARQLRYRGGAKVPGNILMKTWLRPTKWNKKTILEPTLQDSAKLKKFQAAAIDRAFYKSSNMMALQTMADHGMW